MATVLNHSTKKNDPSSSQQQQHQHQQHTTNRSTTSSSSNHRNHNSTTIYDEERIPLVPTIQQHNYNNYNYNSSSGMNNHNNNSSGTINTLVTSNRSGDSLKNAQYAAAVAASSLSSASSSSYHSMNHRNCDNNVNSHRGSDPSTPRHIRKGSVAIIASSISILLCIIALISFGISYVRYCIVSNTVTNKNIYNNEKMLHDFNLTSRFTPRITPNNNSNNDDNNSNTLKGSTMDQQRLYAQQYYDPYNRYIMEDYDVQPIMTNFLPGLAGIYGIPLYAFYMNRGQGITSFGYESKDYPIQEFHSSNIAEQTTPFTGFRTFLQITTTYEQQQQQPQRSITSRIGHLLSWNQYVGKRNIRTKLIEPFDPLRSRYRTPQQEGNDDFCDSPQDDVSPDTLPKRYMYVGSNEVQIQEIDWMNRIETNVTYFVLPEEDFGAFAKRTTITYLPKVQDQNLKTTNSKRLDTISISMVDGLAKLVPAGGKMNDLTKNMGRTLEGWMRVDSPYNKEFDDENNETNNMMQMPYYRLSMLPTDTEQVTVQDAGHWCVSILDEDNDDPNSVPILLPIIYDSSIVFGDDTTLLRPIRLQHESLNNIMHTEKQYGRGKTPSAFASVMDVVLQVGQSMTITTYYGRADHILNVPVIARRLLQPGFAQFKMTRARELSKQITSSVDSQTSNPLMDMHIQQMFLDNSLRGGIPQILGEDNDDSKLRCTDEDERLKVLHLFSRIHGDLERDYNSFELAPTFFSNGPGNFRDVAQNRRNDIFFNPRIGSFNVKTFLSFIQADGYEPLKVESILFKIDNIDDCIDIASQAVGEADGHRAQRIALTNILHSGLFRPGQLFQDMMQQNIELVISRQEFIDMVTAAARTFPSASFVSGYWADHWTYYLDIIESYLSIFPDWEKRIFFEEQLPYFSSPASVNPRSQKYVLIENRGKVYHVRQLNCTTTEKDKQGRFHDHSAMNKDWDVYKTKWQHDEEGHIMKSTPMEKLFLLITLKFAARDPYGIGILYEGGKPGWDDANNGLSSMIGSGTPELYELYTLMNFVRLTIRRYEVDINVPVELYTLVMTINDALDILQDAYVGNDSTIPLDPKVPQYLFEYWDTVSTALELYREKVDQTFIGTTRAIPIDYLDAFIKRWLDEIVLGMERGRQFGTSSFEDDGSSGVPPTYFTYDVTSWKLTGENSIDGHSFIVPVEMEVNILPLFLEGPTRYFKTIATKDASLALYNKVRVSLLRDTSLPMYTISASLSDQSSELGRSTAFPPGWLENQSIWMHISYKFYLELLRHGLYDEFFTEMESGGMLPFVNPKVYGRSIIECTSFVVSSVYDDPSQHGRGYLPRLSGSTSEFLSMYVYIMIGPRPFMLDHLTGGLQMQLVPTLPLSWFYLDIDEKLVVKYKLFGSIDVSYYNILAIDLYDIQPSRYVVTLRDGTVVNISGPIIHDSDLVDKIRRIAFIASLDAYFE